MISLTFAEQVKIILGRKGMTIKELAEIIEERTGKKMSRQNLTQRLNRDNFQEQDMRMITEILGCSFQLNILEDAKQESAKTEPTISPTEKELAKLQRKREMKAAKNTAAERDITMGELVDMMSETDEDKDIVMKEEEAVISSAEEPTTAERSVGAKKPLGGFFKGYLIKTKGKDKKPIIEEQTAETEEIQNTQEIETPTEAEYEYHEEVQQPEYAQADEAYPQEPFAPQEAVAAAAPEPEVPVTKPSEEVEDLERGEVNPYTGHEYQSNSVRIHPKRIGYVQVYDRGEHRWTDMTEWAFLGYQERKKALLGDDYEPPIYLD